MNPLKWHFKNSFKLQNGQNFGEKASSNLHRDHNCGYNIEVCI